MYLSKGGRVTLIKSTISNLPTYFLSLFPLPTKVAHRLEKLQRDLLWGGIKDEFNFHLVKWATICSPIKEEGLGIRNLKSFNQALLGKWLWRYYQEWEALWRTLIALKHGESWGGWCSNEVSGPHGVWLWKHIRKGWDTYAAHTCFKVGNGVKVKFWHDLWCGDRALKDVFPQVYGLARRKEASIANLVIFSNGLPQWNLTFLRD